MADKIATVSRQRIGGMLGRLRREDQLRLDRALVTLLGIGRAPWLDVPASAP